MAKPFEDGNWKERWIKSQFSSFGTKNRVFVNPDNFEKEQCFELNKVSPAHSALTGLAWVGPLKPSGELRPGGPYLTQLRGGT